MRNSGRLGLIAVAWLGAMSSSATTTVQAADLPIVKAPPPAVVMPRWSGFYVGGHIGGAWGDVETDAYAGPLLPDIFFLNPAPPPPFVLIPGLAGTLPGASGSDSSVLGGGQIGFNWQTGSWVFGIEADISGTDLSATATRSATRFGGTAFEETVSATTGIDIDWMASVRGRLGYSFNSVLLYATGGAAIADIDSRGTGTLIIPPAVLLPAPGTYTSTTSDSHLRLGWTLGAGFEWAIDQAWSIGAEYRHSDFGSITVNSAIPDGLGTTYATVASDTRVTVDQATLRVNYRFSAR